jgi:hypothetical protein
MSNASVSTALEHVLAVKDVLEKLTLTSTEVFEIDFRPESFGNWVLIAGRRHRRYRFAWDGRDSWLSVASAAMADSASIPNWIEMPDYCGSAASKEALALVPKILLDVDAA